MSVVRSRLKQALEEKEWTLVKLGKESGISYPTLLNLYHDRTKQISYNTLNKVCFALNCQVNKIIEYVPDE